MSEQKKKTPNNIWIAYDLVNASIPHCRNQMSLFWWSDDGRFFLIKHERHKIYTRFDGAVQCGTHYLLYDSTKMQGAPIGSGYLWKFTGRWSKKKMEQVEKIMKRRYLIDERRK